MKIDKSKLMKRAWEIAKTAVEEFGGKVREYFGESLKMSWKLENINIQEKNMEDAENWERMLEENVKLELCNLSTWHYDEIGGLPTALKNRTSLILGHLNFKWNDNETKLSRIISARELMELIEELEAEEELKKEKISVNPENKSKSDLSSEEYERCARFDANGDEEYLYMMGLD